MMRVEGINMLKNIKDKIFGITVFILFSFICISGFCGIYKVLTLLYTELCVKFNNLFIEVSLLVIPVILSILLSGVFMYIFEIGLKVFIGCCFEEKGVKNEKSL